MDSESHLEVLRRLREVEETIQYTRFEHGRLLFENHTLQDRIAKVEQQNGVCPSEENKNPFGLNKWDLGPKYVPLEYSQLERVASNYQQHVLARMKALENNAEHMRHEVVMLDRSNVDMRARLALMESLRDNPGGTQNRPLSTGGYLESLEKHLETKIKCRLDEIVRSMIPVYNKTEARLNKIQSAVCTLGGQIATMQGHDTESRLNSLEGIIRDVVPRFEQVEGLCTNVLFSQTGTGKIDTTEDVAVTKPTILDNPEARQQQTEKVNDKLLLQETSPDPVLPGNAETQRTEQLSNIDVSELELSLEVKQEAKIREYFRSLDSMSRVSEVHDRIDRLLVEPNIETRIAQLEQAFCSAAFGESGQQEVEKIDNLSLLRDRVISLEKFQSEFDPLDPQDVIFRLTQLETFREITSEWMDETDDWKDGKSARQRLEERVRTKIRNLRTRVKSLERKSAFADGVSQNSSKKQRSIHNVGFPTQGMSPTDDDLSVVRAKLFDKSDLPAARISKRRKVSSCGGASEGSK